jgi:hypothetical protein
MVRCSLCFCVGEKGSECISVMWYCMLLICIMYNDLEKVNRCVCSGRFSIDVSFDIRFLPYKEQTEEIYVSIIFRYWFKNDIFVHFVYTVG